MIRVFTKSKAEHVWRETLAYMSAAVWIYLAAWAFFTWPVLWACQLGGAFHWSWVPIYG